MSVCALSVAAVVLWNTTPLTGVSAQSTGRRETVQLKTVPVTFDKEYGAAIARFGEGKYGEGRLRQMDATLVELPPKGTLAARKHLAEEMIYVVSGTGYTNMWKPGTTREQGKKYSWKTSDVLSPSLNVWREHVNSSPSEPARFLVMTSTPLSIKMFGSKEILSSSDFVFEDRWAKGLQEPKFLERPGRTLDPSASEGIGPLGDKKVKGTVDRSLMAIGHHIPDMRGIEMPIAFGDPDYPETGINVVPPTYDARGADKLGGMAGNRFFEWQNREAIKTGEFIHSEGTHHHRWEVVYISPKGRMESYLQRQGAGEKRRIVQWQEGEMIIVEADEVHMHHLVELGARFLQFKLAGYFRDVGIRPMGKYSTDIDVR